MDGTIRYLGGFLTLGLIAVSAAEAQPCSTHADCDDADPCTADTCNPGTGFCENTPVVGAMFATDGSGGNLYGVDQATGAASLIGSTGIVAPSLAVDPTTRVVYAGSGGGTDDLYTVDSITASSHSVGSAGLGAWSLEGLDFDAAGTLYASVNTIGSGSQGGDSLATLDKKTGVGTIVGSFGVTDIEGVAFDPSGTLYGSSGGSSPSLYTIDVATGAASSVGPIVDGGGTPPAGGVHGLQFDLDGTLYGSTDTGDLLRIDPATGVFAPVGSSGASRLVALAVRDECLRPCRPPLALYSAAWYELYRVDPVTGGTTLIGTDAVNKPSLAIDPITGVYYGGEGAGIESILTVCPITALSAYVGSAGLGAFAIAGLDFAADGTLYASVNTVGPAQGGGDTLATIDKQTGIATVVGAFGVDGLGSIAFGASGTLYGAPGRADLTPSLYTIDPATGSATLVGPLVDPLGSPPSSPLAGIEFDLAGFLYGVTARGQVPSDFGTGYYLIRIDPTTGVFTVVGDLGTVKGLGSLAFHETCRPTCNPPSTLFGSDGSGGYLNEIDQVRGEAAPIGGMGIPAPSLAVDPTTGLLYAGSGSGLDELYRVDPTTGVATLAGTTGLSAWSIDGIDFDAGGTLYASVNTVGSSDPGGDSLAVLDKSTGAGTIVGSFGAGITDIGGLVFDDSGTLYGASGIGGGAPTLYTIDVATGTASSVGPILDVLGIAPPGGVSGLERDLGGVLYGGLDNGDLIRIDPATAEFSPVAGSGLSSLEGLAFLDDCPLDCARDAHCDDGNPCTVESCQPTSGKCVTSLLPDSETARGIDDVCGTADDNPALYGVDGLCGTTDDGAGDGLCDAIDKCPGVYDPANVDGDGDGAGDACDCDPGDNGVWAVPGEVIDLQAEHSGGLGGTTTLTWSPPASPGAASVVYDTLRSDTADTFGAPAGQCLESDDGSDRAASDTLDPSPIFYYVVRAENGCGPGTVGEHSNGTSRPSRACP